MAERRRIDVLLVERGLFESRARAQAAIAAGLVTADGVTITKPASEFAVTAELTAQPVHPYVSRGGVKLAAALEAGAIDPAGRVCLDIGASTGGFTEVLLARGARRVYAVDVGRGQLHATLQGRPEILSLEETDIRKVTPTQLGEAPDLIVIDVSFISLKHILPSAFALAAPHCDLVALIKPQFEVRRPDLKKGIVRDAALRTAVCENISGFLTASGWQVRATITSPITGGDGNIEFFVIARREAALSPSSSGAMLRG
jgi:23S rRNA (cytidine1920-2'-O)/16S rRNA (cytidine1409-2'-O)-methyltransferase